MPLIVNKQEKTNSIANAALHVFLKQGFHQTRMADIAKAAKVGKGTLYEYFRNKNDILKHIYNDHLKLFNSGKITAEFSKAKPSERLIEMIYVFINHIEEWETIGLMFLDYYSVARMDDEFLTAFTELYESTISLLAGFIREAQEQSEIRKDVDPYSAAKTIMCFFDGLILYGSITNRRRDSEVQEALSVTRTHAETFLKLFTDSLKIRV